MLKAASRGLGSSAWAAAALLVCAGAHNVLARTTYNTGGSISISGATVHTGNSSTLALSGATGSVKTVWVKFNGVWSDGKSSDDASSAYFTSLISKGPGNQPFVLFGDAGDRTGGDDLGDCGSGLDNVNLTIVDGAPPATDES